MVVHHFKYVIKLQNTEPCLDAFYYIYVYVWVCVYIGMCIYIYIYIYGGIYKHLGNLDDFLFVKISNIFYNLNHTEIN
jgi:hypothetical protein